MTNEDKFELAEQVTHAKQMGYSKTEAIDRIHKMFRFKKRTIAVYWKTFNEAEPLPAKVEKVN